MKFIGDRKFYKIVSRIALPIVIQNSVSFLINFVDNIMVGQLGTEAMSGVAIVNQLVYVLNTCILGIISGASIFGAQFYGSKDYKSLKGTFRFRMAACIVLAVMALILFGFAGDKLILLFLHSQNRLELENTLSLGKQYLVIIMISLLPFALTQVYSSTARDIGETFLPMCASVAAVLLNTVLNYVLIFGHFGFPQLGVQGAAIATVIARFVECIIIITVAHIKRETYIFARKASEKTELALIKRITKTGAPLMINEFFWSIGSVIVIQCYSMRGINVIAGINIATTIYNIFSIFYMAVGSCIAIMTGQLLGAGKMEEARDTDNKLIFLAAASSVIIAVFMAAGAPFIPKLYNTSDEVHKLAASLIYILALCIPITSLVHAEFFTIRAGGNTIITLLFDSSVLWLIRIPLAFFLVRCTDIHIVYIYLICQMTEIIKCVIGFVLVRKGVWLNKITS